MSKSHYLLDVAACYAYLVSGIVLNGAPVDGAYSFSSLLFYMAGVFAAWMFIMLVPFAGRMKNGNISIAFCLFGFFICCALFGVYANSFAGALPWISPDYSDARFTHLFVLLSAMLALYAGKRETVSYSRICILVLPLTVLPYMLTWFDFIGYKSAGVPLMPEISFDLRPEFFARGFGSAAGAYFVMCARGKKASTACNSGFILFAITCVAECVKYIIWFGADGLGFVSRPDRTMLASVPFMNVQEVFLFSFYFAFILRATVFCTAARLFFNGAAKRIKMPEWINYASTSLAAYIFYAVFRKNSVMPSEGILMSAVFVGIVLYKAIKNIPKIQNVGNNK